LTVIKTLAKLFDAVLFMNSLPFTATACHYSLHCESFF